MDNNSLVVQLGMNIQNLEAGLNKSNSLMNGFKDKVTEIGRSLGAAFAVERVAEFGLEVSKLAGQADGVKRVFDQLRGSEQVLRDMKEATQGTVADLELMKYAVQADNFNIPIEQMGKLFEFAHQRALATGQSVDYLVQSIVTGIGRKSPLILDNLGISAVTLREKLKGVGLESASVGDIAEIVGEIATESINKFGKATETEASMMEALGASWENLKVVIGGAINSGGVFKSVLQSINAELQNLASNQLSFSDKLLSLIAPEAISLKEKLLTQQQVVASKKNEAAIQSTINQYFKEGWTSIEAFGKAIEQNVNKAAILQGIAQKLAGHQEVVKNIDFYEKEIKDLREQEGQAIGANLTRIQATIEAEQQKLDILKLQFQIQRDAANSSTLGKMRAFDTDFGLDPKLAKSNVSAPADNANKANAAIQKSIQLLDQFNKKSLGYKKSFDDVFDAKKINQFSVALNNGTQALITDLAAALGSFASGAQSSDQIFATLLSSVGSMAIQLGQLAIGTGLAIMAIQEALGDLFGGPGAVAAGIALVALGSAVKGAAANIAKGSGGGSHSVAPSSSGSSYGKSSEPQQIYGTTKISGQELWIVLSNYKTNSNYTRIG